jgi:hypothetical protein
VTMEDTDLRLDGNAAAGLLAEVFRTEMTTAEVACAGCGSVAVVAELMRYGHGMGAILRCARCDTAVIRVSQTRHRHWLDLRGARMLRLAAATA